MEERTGRVIILGVLLIAALVFLEYETSYAASGYKTAFEKAYPFAKDTVIDSCKLCHTSASGSAPRNPYGVAYGTNSHSFTAIADLDSDGDGLKNITEIKDLTFPGDAASKPKPPTVTVFNVNPVTTPGQTATITSFVATSPSLATITGYMVTETSTKPEAGSAGWTSTKPATYTFATAGAKTFYAWARDRAGLVSASNSLSVAVAAPVGNAAPQAQAQAPASAAGSLMPLPDGQETFTYDTAAAPVRSVDPASAMPVGGSTSGEGEDTLDMQVSIGKIEGPVSEESYFEPEDVYSLQPGNTLEPIDMGQAETIGVDTWKTNVVEVDETVFSNFATAGAETFHAWARDTTGLVSAGKSASVAVAALAGGAATQAQAPASAAKSLMPLPDGQGTFTYDTAAAPIRSVDPASAMPVGVSTSDEGEDTLDMQVSIGRFEGPVNVYLTLYVPVEESYFEPKDVYSLQPDNTLKPIDMEQVETIGVDPWKTNVDEVDEEVFSKMPQSQLPAGRYLVVLTVTNANNEDAHYAWMTHFMVQ